MKIYEEDSAWKVVFFEDAVIKDTRENEEKGYKVLIGEKDGRFVPAVVEYHKDRYTLPDVIKYAKRISECAICKELNENVAKIEEMKVKVPPDHITYKYSSQESSSAIASSTTPAPAASSSASSASAASQASSLWKAIFARSLSRPALVMLASLTDDSELMEYALPHDEEDANALMDELLRFLRGEIPFYNIDENKNKKEKKKRKKKKKKRVSETGMRAMNVLAEVMKYD